MGTGTRAAGTLHAEIIDDFKDQLLLITLDRLQRGTIAGEVVIPVAEVDAAGDRIVSMQLIDTSAGKAFRFVVSKKS